MMQMQHAAIALTGARPRATIGRSMEETHDVA